MRTVSHHGRATAYRYTPGEGRPVVYVHGSGATGQVWGYQHAGTDRPTAALDLSGHGDSDDVDREPGAESLTAYAADTLAVAREVEASAIVGNSLGGAVALYLLLESDHPFEVAVLCGTGAKLSVAEELREMLREDFRSAVDALHEPGMLFHDPDPKTLERSRRAMHSVGQATTERDFLTSHAFDIRGRLKEIELPVLALTGEYDRLTPVAFHEYLAEELPEGRLAVVENAAHLPFLERPKAWNPRVSSFL